MSQTDDDGTSFDPMGDDTSSPTTAPIRPMVGAVGPGKPSGSRTPVIEYHERLHPWAFIRTIAWAVVLGLMGFVALVISTFATTPWSDVFIQYPGLLQDLWGLWAVGGIVSSIFILRSYLKWRWRPLWSSSIDGVLWRGEKGSRLLFIGDSEPDRYPMGDLVIDTPKRSFFEMYFLNNKSNTLNLIDGEKVTTIRFVRNIEVITKIASTYLSFQARQNATLEEVRDQSLITNELLRGIQVQNLEMLELVERIAQALERGTKR